MDQIHRRDFDMVTNENYESAQLPHETGNFGSETNDSVKSPREIEIPKQLNNIIEKNSNSRQETL